LCPNSKYPLELFEAVLLNEGSFRNAFQGCTFVFHTASPVITTKVDDPQLQILDPAIKGTQNVLKDAASVKTVKRLILTSSMAAICGNQAETNPSHVFSEVDWNNDPTTPYSRSKVEAEKIAWEMIKSLAPMELVVINPSFVLGPTLSARTDSSSVSSFKQLIEGAFEKGGAPAFNFGYVDVRDVSKAHILAAETSSANGRYICSNEDQSNFLELAKLLKIRFPEMKLPTTFIGSNKPLRIKGTNNSKIIKELKNGIYTNRKYVI